MKMLSALNAAAHQSLFDYQVVDQAGVAIGTVQALWNNARGGQLEYLGVKTGWLFGSTHVVPVGKVSVDEAAHQLCLPYTTEQVKGAPTLSADALISDEAGAEIARHYANDHTEIAPSAGVSENASATLAIGSASARRVDEASSTTQVRGEGEAEVVLYEESLQVGKRRVDAGFVRLRKVVRTEIVQIPVELRSEHIVVERVAPGDVRPGDLPAANARVFEDQEFVMTESREEAVVTKKVLVTGGVRVRKTDNAEQQTVRETLRKEDVEVESIGTDGNHTKLPVPRKD